MQWWARCGAYLEPALAISGRDVQSAGVIVVRGILKIRFRDTSSFARRPLPLDPLPSNAWSMEVRRDHLLLSQGSHSGGQV